MKKIVLIAAIITSISLYNNIYCQVNKQDSLALVEFYNNGGENNWNRDYSKSWLKGNVNGWLGVTVEDNRVIKLHISVYNGAIHPSIGNLSVLKSLELYGFSDSIPSTIGNLTSLETLRILGNKITGSIPESIGNLKKLEYLNLSGNQLTGSIPSSIGSLYNLIKLELDYNDLSGEIPHSIGNLTKLKVLSLEENDLSGEIPSSLGSLNSLESLHLFYNDLTGDIPSSIGNLNSLERLYIFSNSLTGELPSSIGNLSELKDLGISDNNLSGEIPSSIGNLTNLKTLYLHENNFSGEIPQSIGNLSSITKLNLKDNNLSGTIPESIGNLNKLLMLSLRINNLSGEIPESIGNITEIKSLFLSENNFYGEVPSSIQNLTSLYDIYLNDNNLSSIPKIPANLAYISVGGNNFDFDDLEPLVKEGLTISGNRQNPLILERKNVGESVELTMNCGGTKNTYQWYYNINKTNIKDTNKTYIVPKDKDIEKLFCRAKNSLLKGKVLTGIPPEEINCWETEQLTFCIHSGKWEKGGTNKIKSTNIVSINEILFFDGTMTIDTTALEINALGEFYLDNIPIPGGSIGKYSLASGEYSLKLIGNEKKITNFLNSNLTASANLFGNPLIIEDLQFIKKNDTLGVKLGGFVRVTGLSATCGIYKPGTDISIKNLEITNKGIFFGGFEVENLGFILPGFCLNKFTYDYNWDKDILIAGANVSIPFMKGESATIGAAIKLEQGYIDSLSWYIEASALTLPISPPSTFGVMGFYGHIAGLKEVRENNNDTNLDIKIGGIFTDVITDNIYKITGDGRTVWPKLFEISGTGELIDPPGDFAPYQFKGKTKISLNIPNKQLKISIGGEFGKITSIPYYLGTADGTFTIDQRHPNDPPNYSATFGSTLSLPKLYNGIPFTWMESLGASFPITIGSHNAIFNDGPYLIHGILYFYPKKDWLWKINYIFDTEKSWYQSGFVTFPYTSRVGVSIEEEMVYNKKYFSNTFIIPEDTDFAIFEIKSQVQAPQSSLVSQSGKEYLDSSIEDNIIYSISEDKKNAFWSILNPKAGDWSIKLQSPSLNDSIIAHFQEKKIEFKFSMNQNGNKVNVNWDIAQVEEGQTVRLMLDTDNENFDGFVISEGDANTGHLDFILDEDTPNCNYNLYVQLISNRGVVQSYADGIISNPLVSLAPPLNFNALYDEETGEIILEWDTNPTSNVSGYIISILDEQQNDSVYTVLNSQETSISLLIVDFENKSAIIEAYNNDWKIGCPSIFNFSTMGVEDDFEIEKEISSISIFPNPTKGLFVIRYYVSQPSLSEIIIYDIHGREIAKPLSEFKQSGYHKLEFKYQNISKGIYIIKYKSINQSATIKSVLE